MPAEPAPAYPAWRAALSDTAAVGFGLFPLGVAFGVLLDTFVVRSLLVPAAAYDLGRVIWWPSKLWRPTSAAGAPTAW